MILYQIIVHMILYVLYKITFHSALDLTESNYASRDSSFHMHGIKITAWPIPLYMGHNKHTNTVPAKGNHANNQDGDIIDFELKGARADMTND